MLPWPVAVHGYRVDNKYLTEVECSTPTEIRRIDLESFPDLARIFSKIDLGPEEPTADGIIQFANRFGRLGNRLGADHLMNWYENVLLTRICFELHEAVQEYRHKELERLLFIEGQIAGVNLAAFKPVDEQPWREVNPWPEVTMYSTPSFFTPKFFADELAGKAVFGVSALEAEKHMSTERRTRLPGTLAFHVDVLLPDVLTAGTVVLARILDFGLRLGGIRIGCTTLQQEDGTMILTERLLIQDLLGLIWRQVWESVTGKGLKRFCKVCGKPIPANKRKGTIYCSEPGDTCKNRAYQERQRQKRGANGKKGR